MKEKIGEVFSVAKDNPPVPGCTISKEVHGGENYITYFSLAKDTDISAEIYPYHKLLIVADGSVEVYGTAELSKKAEIHSLKAQSYQAVFLHAGVCLEGAIIVLACIIFSKFAASPPVVDNCA